MIAAEQGQTRGGTTRPNFLLAGLTTGHMVNDFYAMILPPIFTGYMADLFGLHLAFKLLVVFALLAACLSLTLPGKHAPAAAVSVAT